MALVKVPEAHHPIFEAALPRERRVETLKMFGGVVAKVNGNVFAGLFGESVMIWLPEADRDKVLALPGAAPFDPMGDGRARSDKVMLPAGVMKKPGELKRWLARAFAAASKLTPKGDEPTRAVNAAKSARASAKPAPRTKKTKKAAPSAKIVKKSGGRRV